jgi:hypothetical protein
MTKVAECVRKRRKTFIPVYNRLLHLWHPALW